MIKEDHSVVALDGASISAEIRRRTTTSLQGIAGDAQA